MRAPTASCSLDNVLGEAQHCDEEITGRIVDRLVARIDESPTEGLVEVLAMVATDYAKAPRTHQEQVSAMLIDRLGKPGPAVLSALRVLSRARITAALPSIARFLASASNT